MMFRLPILMLGVFSGFIEAAAVIRGPYLQSGGTDRMTVCWRTDVATTSDLAYATAIDGPFNEDQDPGVRTDHSVTISGLQSNQKYFYRVRGTPDSGTPVNLGGVDYWFRTAPAPKNGTPTRIWVVGDSGYQFAAATNSYNSYLNKTSAEQKETSAFLMLGDNAYDIAVDSQLQGALFNRYTMLMRSTPTWSAFGNHDGYSVPYPYTAATPHESVFHFPASGESGGIASGSERYYSFNHGDIHFICLDTNTPGSYDDVPGGPYGMVDWLVDDLKACTCRLDHRIHAPGTLLQRNSQFGP